MYLLRGRGVGFAVGNGCIVGVNHRLNDNKGRVKRGLTTHLNVSFCSGRLVGLTSRRDKLYGRFFRGTSRGTSRKVVNKLFNVHFPFVDRKTVPYGGYLDGSTLFGMRDSIVHHLTTRGSYIFMKHYTSCVLERRPHYTGIFVSTSGRSHVVHLYQVRGIGRRITRRVVRGTSGEHSRCCGCCDCGA